MKKIGVLAMVSLVSMASFASDVEPSLEQADKLELQGETESAIHVLEKPKLLPQRMPRSTNG